MTAPPAGAAPFVGREQELSALRACLDRAYAGQGGVALLAGEPGIGKTRLAEECAAEAQPRGVRVLWGRTYEGEGAPAFWPWVEVLRGLLRAADTGDARALLDIHAAEIAQLLPELRRLLPDVPEPPELPPAQARFRLFDAVTEVLLRAARAEASLLLVLDDLHWADEPSLLLLEFLARELGQAPLLVVGTYREVALQRGDPLARVLGDLTRRPHVTRLPLSGLAPAAISRLIESTTGVPAADRLAERLAGETGGNPLFVTEMVRLLTAEGRLHLDIAAEPDVTGGVPHTVRAAIGRRLDQLSAECGRVLTVAAVAGRDFEIPLLERVTELPADALLALLEEAEVARLVTEVPALPGRYRFTHALIRDTLYEELPATRRARLHHQLATALEALYADAAVDDHLAELAHHFAAAAAAGGAAKAAAYLRRAGDQALALLAYEEAARLYEQALALLRLRPGATEEHTALLLALGDAQTRTGDRAAATATFTTALTLARRVALVDVQARAALGLVGATFVTEVEDSRQVAAVLEQALAALDPADSALRARLLTRLAFATADPRAMGRAPLASSRRRSRWRGGWGTAPPSPVRW